MKSFLLSTLFSLLLFSIIFVSANIKTPTIQSGEYSSSLKLLEGFNLYWSINQKETGKVGSDDIIEFALEGKTSGWMSIGIDFVNSPMNQADCYIGYYDVEKKAPVVVDAYLPGKSIPKDDRELSGINNILEINGAYNSDTGITTLKFTRYIDTKDTNTDKPIRNATINLSYAWNTNTKDITKKHTNAGKTTVNFMDLAQPPTPPRKYVFPFHLVATGSVVGLMILIGLAYTFIGWKSHSLPIDFIFHKRFFPLIKNKYLGHWLLNPILDITIGEVILVFTYLALAASWFTYGFLHSKSKHVAKGLGYLNILNVAFLVVPVTRYSVFMFIFGVSFERAIKFHKWIARFTYLAIGAHAIAMIVEFADNITEIFTMEANDYPLLGVIAWGCMTILVLFTFEPIRRRFWELFKVVHFVFGVPFLVLVNIHGGGLTKTLPITAASLVLLVLDHLLRIVLGLFVPAKVVNLEYHEDSGVTVCTLQKSAITFYSFDRLGYGKFVYLYIPAVSIAQWHPFSISNYTKYGSYVEFTCCVKNMGRGWTKELANYAQKKGGNNINLLARVEGPYGRLSISPNTYDTIVLIAGGIGITFINSLYTELMLNQKNTSRKSYHVIWTMKDDSLLKLFPELLEKRENVEYSFYMTRKSNDRSETDKRFNYGRRPNFKDYLYGIGFNTEQTHTIGVFACGPREMLVDVQNAIQKTSCSGARFQLHKEVFEM
ncbi:hypothetical protein ABK040_005922 [Willaertia magna]